MAEPGAGTFAQLLRRLVERGVIGTKDSVFVQFAGKFDEEVCASVGLTNCHFGNIAPGTASTGQTIARRFDAHRMPQVDGSYEHVLAHAGLHHCSRPHEALHEMYRLATNTVVFVENQDSWAMRAAGRARIVSEYEVAAVASGDYSSGGVDGTGVPNYVYRWTRREVRKAVAAFDPAYQIPIEFRSEWNLGAHRVSAQTLRRKLRLRSDEASSRLMSSAESAMNIAFGRQGNIFAATIRKDLATLHAWMESPNAMRR